MRYWLLIILLLCSGLTEAWAQTTPTLPTLPQATVSTTRPVVNGTTCTGATLAAVQACLNTAAALTSSNGGNNNNEVVFTAGSTVTGTLNLPGRGTGATGWIVLRSSNSASLPENVRVSPASASNMPQLTSPTSGSYNRGIQVQSNAHHYWLIGIHVRSTSTVYAATLALVDFGGNDVTSHITNTHHMVFDRGYLHGTGTGTHVNHGIILDTALGTAAILDSYIETIVWDGDSQAVWSMKNSGPMLVQNNYLDAKGENLMLCGAGVISIGTIPSDVTIVRNTLHKPTTYRTLGDGLIKALIEFKCGRRILVEGNLMDGAWAGYQDSDGSAVYSFRLTVRNDEGDGTYTMLDDLTIRYNKIFDVSSTFNLTSSDGNAVSDTANRIYIHDNLWYAFPCGAQAWNDIIIGGGQTGPAEDWTIDHNSIISLCTQQKNIAVTASAGHVQRFSFRSNIMAFKTGLDEGYRCECPGVILGTAGLNTEFGTNGWFFNNNIFVRSAGYKTNHPTGNFWPTSYANVQFVDIATNNYRLAPGSPYKDAGHDGTDVGADIDAMEAAIAGTAPPPDTSPPAAPTGVMISRIPTTTYQ